jgi:hypothetical protein
MKIFHIALFAVGVFLESSAMQLHGPSRGVRGLLSRIVGGIKANTSEQPHAAYSSRLTYDVTIPMADGSPMSIPIKDLALMIFVLITTNDWNGDGILITEVASALLEGLPNWILPDV